MNQVIESCVAGLNEMGGGFCDYAGAMFVQSGLLVVLLLIVDVVIRKRVRATVRYWLWMLVFAKLLLPPTLSLPTGIGSWGPEAVSMRAPAVEPVRQPQGHRPTHYRFDSNGDPALSHPHDGNPGLPPGRTAGQHPGKRPTPAGTQWLGNIRGFP